ncbi:putative membrane protein [Exiguobacterium sp. S17]|nr:putative membrane protein [Exiguobacterium sp. S17]
MLSRNVYPQTRPGKWSVVLLFAVFLLLVVSTLIVQSGQPFNFDTLFDNTWGVVFSMSAIAAALSAFVVGLYTILRNHERSVAVFFTVSLGGLVALFVLMQLLG